MIHKIRLGILEILSYPVKGRAKWTPCQNLTSFVYRHPKRTPMQACSLVVLRPVQRDSS